MASLVKCFDQERKKQHKLSQGFLKTLGGRIFLKLVCNDNVALTGRLGSGDTLANMDAAF